MGSQSHNNTSSGSWGIPHDVKYVDWIIVAGGGGGGRPSTPPGWGRSPSAGGGSSTSFGMSAGGGGPGSPGDNFTQGGYGGWGNYANGQAGWYNTSGSEYSRAASGYGSRGYGGAGQWRSGYLSAGGGGGGASCCRVYRNSNGAIPNQSVSYTIGQGGQQGGSGNRRYGGAGAVYATATTWNDVTASVSLSPSTIIIGETATLSWSAGGEWTDVNLNPPGSAVAGSGSITVSPSYTTTYQITVSNPAYSRSGTATLTVYVPPVVTMNASPSNTITLGESVTLNWSVTGDADSYIMDNGIGNVPASSNTTVTPTTDTTYTLTASGLGGTASASVTVTVLYPPTITVNAPVDIDFNDASIPLNITGTNSDGGVTVTATYYTNGIPTVQSPIAIPNSSGATFTVQTWPLPVTWGTYGPDYIKLEFEVDGYGPLIAQAVENVGVNIDRTPAVFIIPQSMNKLPDEEPVITPDDTITTDKIEVDDIDIPVEIRASQPILVEIDEDDTWHELREL